MPCLLAQAPEPAAQGKDSERRFPPLKLPADFHATLFACDPLIEYPSVLAIGPHPGSIILAYDYMTGLGTEITRRDEIRIVEDTNGDGYADASTLFASGFNSIQGLAYDDGRVFAMHAPFLTALRDADGDGVAEERRDLLTGLGWPPEKCPDRLHCANGVVAGHDGWLYLALGDRGCDVARPEGDRLVLAGGGILRCRPDGRDLHVFASGLRNIYDVALDADLNVFVRDNENDGGTYKVRVYRSFFGADHGYPYLYEAHPQETLAPLADVGLGSSAGGACYLGTAFPPAFRGDLFFCEWGRSVVRYHREALGSGFAPMKESEFATGGDADPYGFKPTDVVVDRDGSLLVADWGDGQRPKRGRGRVYRIRHGDAESRGSPVELGGPLEAWVGELDAESQHTRLEAQAAIERRGEEGRKAIHTALGAARVGVLGRLHAVWILARSGARESTETLLRIAETDAEPRVRAQAVRAIADLGDPVLVEHRLGADHGDVNLARRLAAIGKGQDARILLEVMIALGRLRWAETPRWIAESLTQLDTDLAHAALQALRRSRSWSDVLSLLDAPATSAFHALALHALAGQYDPIVAAGLIHRLGKEGDATRRVEYVDALARIQKKPAAWVYWGFRPGPRPANTVAWEPSDAIAAALNGALADPDPRVRAEALQSMRREKIPAQTAYLARWLREERSADRVASILETLGEAPGEETFAAAAEVVASTEYDTASRVAAVGLVARAPSARLLELSASLDDSVVLAEAMHQLAKRRENGSAPLFRRGLGAATAEVRAAAAQGLAAVEDRAASSAIARLLEDRDVGVRRAAAAALSKVGGSAAAVALLQSAADGDADVRRKSLDALRALKEPRAAAIAAAALKDHDIEVAAIECLSEVSGPEHVREVVDLAMNSRSLDVLSAASRALEAWSAKSPAVRAELEEAFARMHGAIGIILRWRVGTAIAPSALDVVARLRAPDAVLPADWTTVLASGPESSVTLPPSKDAGPGRVSIACADLLVGDAVPIQVLASSNGALQVWINARAAYRREQEATFRPDSDRFDADLAAGRNRIVVQVTGANEPQIHLRFRRRSSTEAHERLTQLALTTSGDPERGRAVLADVQKSACLKCHRLGGEGGGVGPELTGVGRRFSRIHIVESILEPSRTIADSFQAHALSLKDGRVVIGVKTGVTDGTITIGDQEGKTQQLAKSDVETDEPVEVSIMPEGLEKTLTDREFVDLIAFLETQK
jgi:putative membrane-bound dehydrogenase-like protein